MKGQVLVFNADKQAGVIVTPDDERHVFAASQWMEENPPQRGMAVDFRVDENGRACEIFMALGGTPGNSGRSAGRAASGAKKKKSVLTLLTIFLGTWGAHKFYTGAWGWGLVYIVAQIFIFILSMLLPLLSIFLVGFWIFIMVEWVRYILMSDAQFEEKIKTYQGNNPGPFSFFW